MELVIVFFTMDYLASNGVYENVIHFKGCIYVGVKKKQNQKLEDEY